MADDDLNTPYQAPLSLWQLIESCTSVHELPEVKRLLGESLVEQSLELHQEVRSYFLVNVDILLGHTSHLCGDSYVPYLCTVICVLIMYYYINSIFTTHECSMVIYSVASVLFSL